MKTNKLLFPAIIAITSITLAFGTYKSHTTHGEGGQASSCGSPGELGTCSRSTCHGAGASPAGVADNAGPGSLNMTSNPVMTGNQYIPGTTYTMTVTVSQTGKKRFGFGCEILDNSGSTNGHVNNTAGTVVITDHINTRTWQAYGTGRLSVTHDTSGGVAANTYSFNFNWIAPSAGFGTINVYLCGNAANRNLLADSGDYIYSQHIVWTEGSATSLPAINSTELNATVYPVPAHNQFTFTTTLPEESPFNATLYSIDGRIAKELDNRNATQGAFSRDYNVTGMTPGVYLLKVSAGSYSCVKRLIIY